jgi:hypothetical protein
VQTRYDFFPCITIQSYALYISFDQLCELSHSIPHSHLVYKKQSHVWLLLPLCCMTLQLYHSNTEATSQMNRSLNPSQYDALLQANYNRDQPAFSVTVCTEACKHTETTPRVMQRPYDHTSQPSARRKYTITEYIVRMEDRPFTSTEESTCK